MLLSVTKLTCWCSFWYVNCFWTKLATFVFLMKKHLKCHTQAHKHTHFKQLISTHANTNVLSNPSQIHIKYHPPLRANWGVFWEPLTFQHRNSPKTNFVHCSRGLLANTCTQYIYPLSSERAGGEKTQPQKWWNIQADLTTLSCPKIVVGVKDKYRLRVYVLGDSK